MYGITGGCFFDLTFGDSRSPYPVSNSNLYHARYIENAALGLPMVELRIRDVTGFFTTTEPLTDGTPIGLRLGIMENAGDTVPYKFRMFGKPRTMPAPGGAMTRIIGLLDYNKYLKEQVQSAITGTSLDVLQQISSTCGMKFSYLSQTPPNDRMTWGAYQKAWVALGNHAVAHGYVDENSCLHHGVTADGTLTLVNLAEQVKKTPTVLFYHNNIALVPQRVRQATAGQQYLVLDYNEKNHGGIMNHLGGGYVSGNGQMGMTGAFTRNSKIAFTTIAKSLNVNADVYGALSTVRQAYVPPDNGNAHANYARARNQNRRNKLMYSQHVDFVVQATTPVKLFDVVYYEAARSDNNQDDNVSSGKYVVTARSRALIGNLVYEKYHCESSGDSDDSWSEDYGD